MSQLWPSKVEGAKRREGEDASRAAWALVHVTQTGRGEPGCSEVGTCPWASEEISGRMLRGRHMDSTYIWCR